MIKKKEVSESVKVAEDKILSIANVDSVVAKEMLTQFPEFNLEAREVLDYYKVTLESVKECHRAACIGHLVTIKGLYSLLENEDLSFEQQMQVVHEMKELSEKVAEISKTFADKIRENWQDAAALIGLCILGGIGLWRNKGQEETEA